MRDKLGMNCHLANDPQLWAAASSLGVRFCRLDLNWDTAQPAIDRWDWDVIDRAVSGATSHGLNIYATLSHTPTWANAGAGRGAPPTSIDYWTRFVREAGLRYGPQSAYGQIKVWGVWNEWQGSVDDYFTLLFLPAANVLRQIDRENLLCGPELATEGSNWPSWLRMFLDKAGPFVDVLTVHAYDDDGAAVWDKLTKPRRWWEPWKKPSVKQVIEQAGYAKKPCWVTETGFQSGVIGEDNQARYFEQILERLSSSSWPSGILWFALVDEPTNSWGMFRQDHSEKPAVDVLRRYTTGGTV